MKPRFRWTGIAVMMGKKQRTNQMAEEDKVHMKEV